MNKQKRLSISLWVCGCLICLCAFMLTFTLSDYYIFNRAGEFGYIFPLCQWAKKAGVILIACAVLCKSKKCADALKYLLPLCAIISCFTYGEFFDITKVATTPQQEIYNSVNLFFPTWLNITLFFVQNALYIVLAVLLFVRDGFKTDGKMPLAFALAMLATLPLNIFENFFDITKIPADSPLRFKNYSVWHLLAVVFLFGFTFGCYFALRRKSNERKNLFLIFITTALLVQYHSKNSVILGDGYNVYHTIFACIPLFICNIGVYTASLSIYLKKRVLYDLAFFIHAVGALSVFFYFGKDEMSNFGIFCSYSFLFFTITHAWLFAISVLPTLFGQYKFSIKRCAVPLIYYFIVIIVASISSALVTSASSLWHTQEGYYLTADELLMPNYAFTQINPLPFEVPSIFTLRVWKYDINLLYIVGLYAFYVGLFFAFTALYYIILALQKKLTESGIYATLLRKNRRAQLAASDDEKQ